MKFKDIKYSRPDIIKITKDYQYLLKLFNSSKKHNEQIKIINKINKLRGNFRTLQEIAQIRHDVNTKNAKYSREKKFFDEKSPLVEKFEAEFFKSIINSKFKKELKNEFGNQIFNLAECTVKTFDKKIIPLLKKENKLSSEYIKLISGAKIKFNNAVLNLSELKVYSLNPDQLTRKKAQDAKYSFFSKNSRKLDKIFDELVKIRHKIATTLGYKNFTELAYLRMQRVEYNEKDIAVFREQIKKYITPLVKKLKANQAERLKLKKLKYYDEPIDFLSGNPKPQGDINWIIQNTNKMFAELSPETKIFFNHMLKNELMDLKTKKDKRGGGYCVYLFNQKSPFIFSNFNGTSGDIDVLTHEAGHAFQAMQSKNVKLVDYIFSTAEVSEIHSTSMEFFTWPWMELFFKEGAEKYKFSHLESSVDMMTYIAVVDEFQHFVYKNPLANPKERNLQWRKIEKKYMPWRDYADNKFCNNGGFWQQQMHIYLYPFYYIDYALATTCALQFWIEDKKNHLKAWKNYLTLCNNGGSKTFSELLKIANLKSPFHSNTLKPIIKEVEKYFESADKSELN